MPNRTTQMIDLEKIVKIGVRAFLSEREPTNPSNTLIRESYKNELRPLSKEDTKQVKDAVRSHVLNLVRS